MRVIFSFFLLLALMRIGQAQLPSGTYVIHSLYQNDNRCVDLKTQDNQTIQLYFCTKQNNAPSLDEQFKVTRNGDGTYSVVGVKLNTPIGVQIDNGTPKLHAAGNRPVTWKIVPALGAAPGSNAMSVAVVSGVFLPGVATPTVGFTGWVWNRQDPSNDGAVQLVRPPTSQDAHNNWRFEPVP